MIFSLTVDTGRERYEARIPGPDDLWMIVQHGGERSDGTVAGYGSQALRELLVILTEALPHIEQREFDLEEQRAAFAARENAPPASDGKPPTE